MILLLLATVMISVRHAHAGVRIRSDSMAALIADLRVIYEE
jgi:hypothetical protein